MAIKNKDGTVYVLRGPNPLMSEQIEWDKSKVQLINLGVRTEEVIDDVRNPVEEFQAKIPDISKDLNLESKQEKRAKVIAPQKFLDEIKETPKEPTVFKMPEPTVLNVDQKTARLLRERGVEYYCAPAIGRKKFTDDLYGSTYETVEYGEKFIFDAIVIDLSDLELQFWCVKPITAQSVIYKRNKQGGERWWKITEVESKMDGWLAKAITSDLNPDFS